jgi:SAM-dependent methyltransferase
MGASAYGLEADSTIKRIADYFDLNVFIGRLADSPYIRMKFDLIILNQVIEHLHNPSEVLSDLKGMLKENVGVIAISCPNTNSVYRYCFGKNWINWHLPFHRNHFNRNSLRLLAEKCGYKLSKYQTITPNTWSEIQVQNLFNKYFKFLSSDPWSVGLTARKKSQSLLSRLFRKIIWLLISLLVLIFNRIIDFFGCGDSIICELQLAIIDP